MACRYPGYYLPQPWNEKKPYQVAFQPDRVAQLRALDPDGLGNDISCGRCFGCRLNKRKEWTYRLCNEAEMYSPDLVWFVTLTYNDQSLHWGYSADLDPSTGELLVFSRPTLFYDDFDKFRMRLTQKLNYKYRDVPNYQSPRHYFCGEYGSQTYRPHYHVILFGISEQDLAGDGVRFGKHGLKISENLSKLWGHGFAVYEPASYETMEYVAGYVLKKSIGLDKTQKLEYLYAALDLEPEFEDFRNRSRLVMPDFMCQWEKASGSNRPGIGRPWYEAHKDEVYNTDEMTIMRKGRPLHVKPVSYYDHLFDAECPGILPQIKMVRIAKEQDRQARILEESKLTAEQFLELQLSLDESNFKKITRATI